MAALIGLVTKPELQWIRATGLGVVEISVASFCRMFNYDAGRMEPGRSVVFITLPVTMYEMATFLAGGVESPALRMHTDPCEPSTSA